MTLYIEKKKMILGSSKNCRPDKVGFSFACFGNTSENALYFR